jgi:hypothetical protein
MTPFSLKHIAAEQDCCDEPINYRDQGVRAEKVLGKMKNAHNRREKRNPFKKFVAFSECEILDVFLHFLSLAYV